MIQCLISQPIEYEIEYTTSTFIFITHMRERERARAGKESSREAYDGGK